LINGATGTAGSLGVKIAYHLGAKKVIVTGRNSEKLSKLGADEMVAFDMNAEGGVDKFTADLAKQMQAGVDVVLDYLWGDSAIAIMKAVAMFGGHNVTRFVSIGASAGQADIALPSAVLRSSAIEILGSGVKSATMQQLMTAINGVFQWAASEKITMTTNNFDLSDIDKAWKAPLTPRAVVTVK